MRKITLLIMFVMAFVLSIVSVEGQISNAAKIAGYHSILYTNNIQVADSGLPVAVVPDYFVIGNGINGSMDALRIEGDGAGNYNFRVLTAGKIVSFSNPVEVRNTLLVNGGVNALRYCDLAGANCINGAWVVGIYNNVSSLQIFRNGVYTNVTNLQGAVISLQDFRTNVYTNVTNLQTSVININTIVNNLNSLWTQNGNDIWRNSPGNVGIGMLPAAGNKLDIAGNIRSSGIVSGSSLSASGAIGSTGGGTISTSGTVSGGTVSGTVFTSPGNFIIRLS